LRQCPRGFRFQVAGLRLSSLRGRYRSDDHDLGRLDERRGSLADLQAEVSSGVPGNDGGDPLPADIEGDLGQEADRLDLSDAPHQLVSPADKALEARPTGAGAGPALRGPALGRAALGPRALPKQHAVNLGARNTVMAARCLDGPNLPPVYPLLESGIAHSQFARGLAQVNKLHDSHRIGCQGRRLARAYRGHGLSLHNFFSRVRQTAQYGSEGIIYTI